jgi:hypothetical protein
VCSARKMSVIFMFFVSLRKPPCQRKSKSICRCTDLPVKQNHERDEQ